MISIGVVVGLLLVVASIIDFKLKVVPSALLTTMILIPLMINVGLGYYENILFGVVAFVFALLLYDLNFFGGTGDIKVLTALGLLSGSIYQLALIIILTLIFGLAWKGVWVLSFKKRGEEIPDEFSFIPVFLFVYSALIVLGGIF